MNKHFKISVIKTEFFTDLENKSVTCKVYYKIKTSDRKLKHVVNNIGLFVDGYMRIGETYTAEATAKTYADDVFVQRAGEQVARAKAESMAYNVVSRYFKRVNNWYLNNIDSTIFKFEDKSNGVIEHNDRYIESF